MSGGKISEIHCIYILFFRTRKSEGACLRSSSVSYVDPAAFRLAERNFTYVWIISITKELKSFIFARSSQQISVYL